MTGRCREDAVETLGPHLEKLASIVHEAIGDFYTSFGKRLHEFERWTQAGMIRDLIVKRLKAYCEGTPGLQPIRDGNASLFGFHSKYIVKVKRLGVGMRPRVPDTQAAIDFDSQIVPSQGELIGHLDATTIYCGYIPTENSPLAPPVFVVCKNDARKVEWTIECRPPAPKADAEIRPSAPPTPGQPVPKVRVKKNRVKKDRKSGTDGRDV